MKKTLLFLFMLISLLAQAQEKILSFDSTDVKSIDGIIAALYEVISGPAGQKRDWNRFKVLFQADARLIAVGKNQQGQTIYRSMSPDEYVAGSGAMLEKNSFFENEIDRTTEVFGSIAQLFSTYQSRREAEGEVFMRGINSIQLIFDWSRWWIIHILWNNESKENPIPAKYLKK